MMKSAVRPIVIEPGRSQGDDMLRWWLNFRWAREAYEDVLAKTDVVVMVCGVTMIGAFVWALAA